MGCNRKGQWIRYSGKGDSGSGAMEGEDSRNLACEVTEGNEDTFEKWTKSH